MLRLHGSWAIVTGSGRGIGRAIALALAAAGSDIAVNYRTNREAADSLCRQIEALGRKALPVQAEVSLADQAAFLVGRPQRHGAESIFS